MKRIYRGPVWELSRKEGISRQAAWFRLNRATGLQIGRPRKYLSPSHKELSFLPATNKNKRKLAIEKLGGICIRCGFTDWRALQIDHVNGGGTQKLKANPFQSVYDVLAGKNLSEYQLLCANCNWIKRHENKELSRKVK